MGGVLRVRTGEGCGGSDMGEGAGRPSKLSNQSRSRPIEVAQPVAGAFLSKAGHVHFVPLLHSIFILLGHITLSVILQLIFRVWRCPLC